jgi:hypothetical protein
MSLTFLFKFKKTEQWPLIVEMESIQFLCPENFQIYLQICIRHLFSDNSYKCCSRLTMKHGFFDTGDKLINDVNYTSEKLFTRVQQERKKQFTPVPLTAVTKQLVTETANLVPATP